MYFDFVLHCIAAAHLGNYGMILLLFETPSGFALFSFVGIYLYEPHAMEVLRFSFECLLSCCYVICLTFMFLSSPESLGELCCVR